MYALDNPGRPLSPGSRPGLIPGADVSMAPGSAPPTNYTPGPQGTAGGLTRAPMPAQNPGMQAWQAYINGSGPKPRGMVPAALSGVDWMSVARRQPQPMMPQRPMQMGVMAPPPQRPRMSGEDALAQAMYQRRQPLPGMGGSGAGEV